MNAVQQLLQVASVFLWLLKELVRQPNPSLLIGGQIRASPQHLDSVVMRHLRALLLYSLGTRHVVGDVLHRLGVSRALLLSHGSCFVEGFPSRYLISEVLDSLLDSGMRHDLNLPLGCKILLEPVFSMLTTIRLQLTDQYLLLGLDRWVLDAVSTCGKPLKAHAVNTVLIHGYLLRTEHSILVQFHLRL